MLLSLDQIQTLRKILSAPTKYPSPGTFRYVFEDNKIVIKTWNKWKKKLLRYLQDSAFATLTERQKINLLLYLLGEDRDEIHIQLVRMGLTPQHNFAQVIQRVDDHMCMTKSIIYRRYHFNTRDQRRTESLQYYLNTIFKLADVCEFGHLRDEMIRDRMVSGIQSDNARAQMLERDDLTMQQAIWIAHFDELKQLRRNGVR